MKAFITSAFGTRKAEIPFTVFNFYAGEVQVRLDMNQMPRFDREDDGIELEAFLRSSNDVMAMLVLTDALKRNLNPFRLTLSLPYLPYGRQDRMCYPGEACSLEVMANLINAQGYDAVKLVDPHSERSVALIERVRVIDSLKYVKQAVGVLQEDQQANPQADPCPGQVVLVSPDKGARGKVDRIGAALGLPVVHGNKRRNPDTGAIEGLEVEEDLAAFKAERFLVVDDLCEGGRTFIELALAMGVPAKRMNLYVTHGLFSKGVEALLKDYDRIFTAFSWIEDENIIELTG